MNFMVESSKMFRNFIDMCGSAAKVRNSNINCDVTNLHLSADFLRNKYTEILV